MPKKIVVIGSSNTDIVIQTKEIPKVGETVLGGKLSMTAGGKGANQVIAALRAGGDVAFIGKIGADIFGDNSLKGFIEDGLDITGILKDPSERSGVALIFVDEHGRNSIAVAPGANANLSPRDINDKRDMISKAGVLLMQMEIPLETIEAAIRIAAENNVRVILNPAPAQQLNDALFRNISILTPNETEAAILTGISIENEDDAERAAKILMAKGTGEIIITMGRKGAYLYNKAYKELVPSYEVKAVDSTAAGDVFNGALAVALSEGLDLRGAARFANTAAAISVTRLGAQSSIPYREEIDKLLLKM